MTREADAPGKGRTRARGLFERFPHGLLLVGEKRRVVSLNEKGRELLAVDAHGAEPTTLTCCELICSALERQLEVGPSCVTERVLESAEPLPDARMELERAGGAETVFVSAARVEAEDVRVLFQLRSEHPRARPRSAEHRPWRSASASPAAGRDARAHPGHLGKGPARR